MKKAIKSLFVFVLVIGLGASVLSIQNVINFKSGASGTPANLVIDLATSFSGAKNTWAFLSQGGEERGRSLLSVVPQVKNLKPRYIRIDHVYDFFPIVQTDGSYSWSEFDQYIRDITATGAKPFLALSYNPQNLGGGNTDMPDLNKWTALVKATIEHVSGRNGLGISDVYYEVWNEPDLFGQFKVYPPKDYRDLYVASSNGALSAQNVLPFKLGGPAITALYKNWFDALVDTASTKRVKFDFFSWHEYGEDTTKFSDDINTVLKWRAEKSPNLELFITESGINAANDEAYDGTLSAIQTLSTISLSADKIDGLFSFEIKDGPGPEQKWGRWGLLTHEKYGTPIQKTRYKALEFMNGMGSGEKLNVAGIGSWVSAFARQDASSSKIFVVNYDPDNKHVEAVPLRLVGIPSQQFLLVRRDFLGKTTQTQEVARNGSWSGFQYFPANSAAIFEVIPQ